MVGRDNVTIMHRGTLARVRVICVLNTIIIPDWFLYYKLVIGVEVLVITMARVLTLGERVLAIYPAPCPVWDGWNGRHTWVLVDYQILDSVVGGHLCVRGVTIFTPVSHQRAESFGCSVSKDMESQLICRGLMFLGYTNRWLWWCNNQSMFFWYPHGLPVILLCVNWNLSLCLIKI